MRPQSFSPLLLHRKPVHRLTFVSFSLEWYRRKLLEQFLLPNNKPLLKPCNAYVFDSDKTEGLCNKLPLLSIL